MMRQRHESQCGRAELLRNGACEVDWDCRSRFEVFVQDSRPLDV